MRRALIFPSLSLLLIAAAPTPFGGWAVITVHDLPEYLVAGRATTIAFTVRQHGVEPMDGLSPTVTVRQKSDRRVRAVREVDARAAGTAGRYEAVLGPADTGSIELTIDANWHTARSTLMPIRVVAAGTTPAPQPAADFGRQLFLAKGCVSCHSKRDDRLMLARNEMSVGPDLTGRGFAADWLAAKLADPARNRVRFSEDVVMPNLGLTEREIGALVAYLNQPPAGAVTATK